MTDPYGRSTTARWTAGIVAVVSAVVLILTAAAAMNRKSSPDVQPTGTADLASLAGESSTATVQNGLQPMGTSTATTPVEQSPPQLPPVDSGLTVDDGFIADDAPLSPFDTSLPAIANLDAGLRDAILSAATDAQAAGIEMVINSGWRSERYQQTLLDEAIATYGSEEEARKWVNTPDASTHVTGEAVDIGPTDAADWLIQHGSDYGLCQAYANEMWHFELLTEPGGVCPAPIVDASAG